MTPDQYDGLEIARTLAAGGVPVFLLNPATTAGRWDPDGGTNGCGYHIPKGWQQTEPDPDVLDRWTDGMAVAAVMGHVLDLVDVDPRNGGTAEAVKPYLPEVHGIAATPSGGWHAYVRSLGIRSRDNVLPGIDVKAGTGGQGHGFAWIAPTLRRPKQGGDPLPYRWRRAPDLAKVAADRSDPDRLAELVQGRRHRDGFTSPEQVEPSPWDDLPEQIGPGQRHRTVHRLASSLRGRGGWRADDAVAYVTSTVWPRIAAGSGDDGADYTLADLEQDVRDAFGRYPDGPSTPPATTADTPADAGGQPEPLDLAALLTGDRPEPAWIVEPLTAAGKLVGIVAKRGEGKSLLALEVACAAATGSAMLDQPEGQPRHVVYLDMEMGPDDLYDRLTDLGYGPTHPRFGDLIGHLHYYQLPSLPPLDTADGGEALEGIVNRHTAELVVVDTVSRVVSGSENDAEPFRDLFRHTETRLKRSGVGLLRLDHFGKDATRGSRGHSAKEDPLDVVWEMAVTGEVVRLACTKGRQVGTPETLTLTRTDDDGRLTHRQPSTLPISDKATEVVRLLARHQVPTDASVREAQQALRDAGEGRGKAAIVEAVRWRKHSRKAVRNHPREPEPGTAPGTTPEPPGTAGNRHREPRVPSKEGTAVPAHRNGTGTPICERCEQPATAVDRDGSNRCADHTSWAGEVAS